MEYHWLQSGHDKFFVAIGAALVLAIFFRGHSSAVGSWIGNAFHRNAGIEPLLDQLAKIPPRNRPVGPVGAGSSAPVVWTPTDLYGAIYGV